MSDLPTTVGVYGFGRCGSTMTMVVLAAGCLQRRRSVPTTRRHDGDPPAQLTLPTGHMSFEFGAA